jgi:protein-tyrosine phosphatase
MDEIIPGLYLGNRLDAESLGKSVPDDWRVICVAARHETPNEPKGAIIVGVLFYNENKEMWVEPGLLDIVSGYISDWLSQGKKVLLHCIEGHERSPLATAWHLVRIGHSKDLNEAYDFVISKHPQAERRLYWLPKEVRPYPYNGDVFKQC